MLPPELIIMLDQLETIIFKNWPSSKAFLENLKLTFTLFVECYISSKIMCACHFTIVWRDALKGGLV